MIKYFLQISLIREDGEKDIFGGIEPKCIFFEEYTDENPIKARKNAFHKAESFIDVFLTSNEIKSERILGIYDLTALCKKMETKSLGKFTIPEIDLWFDSSEENLTLPYRNRLIFGNRILPFELIENLVRECKFYRSTRLNTEGTKLIKAFGEEYEIIKSTPDFNMNLL